MSPRGFKIKFSLVDIIYIYIYYTVIHGYRFYTVAVCVCVYVICWVTIKIQNKYYFILGSNNIFRYRINGVWVRSDVEVITEGVTLTVL